jgi:hypothetical protein
MHRCAARGSGLDALIIGDGGPMPGEVKAPERCATGRHLHSIQAERLSVRRMSTARQCQQPCGAGGRIAWWRFTCAA